MDLYAVLQLEVGLGIDVLVPLRHAAQIGNAGRAFTGAEHALAGQLSRAAEFFFIRDMERFLRDQPNVIAVLVHPYQAADWPVQKLGHERQ
ncbi:MAG: hypothetical protein R3256_10520 [Thalassovita sp.]|nr:hypothetical protein [Thalassovita sp.]